MISKCGIYTSQGKRVLLANRGWENRWKAHCGNRVGGVLGVSHGLL